VTFSPCFVGAPLPIWPSKILHQQHIIFSLSITPSILGTNRKKKKRSFSTHLMFNTYKLKTYNFFLTLQLQRIKSQNMENCVLGHMTAYTTQKPEMERKIKEVDPTCVV
jgi:hypothetical protein